MGNFAYICNVMIGIDKTRIAVYVEKTLRDKLDVMRMKYNGERGRNISESKFVEMCLGEYVNMNRDKWGGIKVSEVDIDFD
ncbi:MAG: hypothetical protein GX567_16430 [Clostridia bacterium]|nr:hypothetical protein [Clostridia bacterium]